MLWHDRLIKCAPPLFKTAVKFVEIKLNAFDISPTTLNQLNWQLLTTIFYKDTLISESAFLHPHVQGHIKTIWPRRPPPSGA